MCSGCQYWCTDRLLALPSSVYQGNTYLSSRVTGSLVVILWVIGPSEISGAEVGVAIWRSAGLASLQRALEHCLERMVMGMRMGKVNVRRGGRSLLMGRVDREFQLGRLLLLGGQRRGGKRKRWGLMRIALLRWCLGEDLKSRIDKIE
jgi:hypothetical protein